MTDKSKFEITSELIKALVWPSFAFAVLIGFWSPLKDSINQVPDLVKYSEEITIGDFSLKVKKQLKSQATDEVIGAISGISSEALNFLVSPSTGIKLPVGWEADEKFDSETINELIDRKLYKKQMVDPPLPEGRPKEEVVKTKIGNKASIFLRGLLVEVLNNPQFEQ